MTPITKRGCQAIFVNGMRETRSDHSMTVGSSGYVGGVSSGDLRMFAAMRHALKTAVATEVSSEMARTVCNFSVTFLDRFIIRHTEWSAILQEQVRRQTVVLKRAADLLASMGAPHAEMARRAHATADEVAGIRDDALEQVERRQRNVDAILEEVLPSLLSNDRMRRPDALSIINELLREQVASIRDAERALIEATRLRTERHEALAARQVEVTREQLQTYLRDRFPERSDLEILSFQELAGGSSKSTVLIDVRGIEHDGATSLVARLDRQAGSTDTKVINEVATLRAIYREGFPVPEIVLVEPDAARLGVAFIIVRKVEASVGGGMWHADPALCNADTARDLAGILARLHSLDVEARGLTGALDTNTDEHPLKSLIVNIRRLLRVKKMDPDATLEACLWWLEEHLPPAPARFSLIHGDVSFHNILVRDKKVVSLLDWELSHLGDPAEDLSYVRPCIEQLMPWSDFLAEYRKHGGGEYDEEIGRYYGIWRGVRNLVYTITAKHSFHSDANPDMRWGLYGTYYRPVLLEAAEKVAASGVRAKSF